MTPPPPAAMAEPKPLPQPPFPLREGERPLARHHAAALHRLGATPGKLWLTSERVVFWPQVPILFWIVLPLGIGLWLVNRPQRRDIPLAKVTAAERTTFGRNRNVLVLVTSDMSRDLKVVVDGFDAFFAALATARGRALPGASPSPSSPSPASSKSKPRP